MRWRSIKVEYTFLFMLELAEEAKLIMHNLIPYLRYKYGNEILGYFINKAFEAAKEDSWDQNTKRVVCSMNGFMEEEEEDCIGLEEAQIYIKENKKAR
jgi:hypothetical protein